MFKEFSHYTAWTDTMKATRGFVGLIEYQAKRLGSRVNVLWVISPDCICEDEAAAVADVMLQEIADITPAGNVVYSDGVFL